MLDRHVGYATNLLFRWMKRPCGEERISDSAGDTVGGIKGIALYVRE